MTNIKRLVLLALCVLLMAATLVGCGGSGSNYEKKLVGSWYFEGQDEPQFELYSDGTCKIAYEYGTGTWDVLDGNMFKLTNYYGETETGYILSIEDGCLTLGDGGENQSVLYNAPNQE